MSCQHRTSPELHGLWHIHRSGTGFKNTIERQVGAWGSLRHRLVVYVFTIRKCVKIKISAVACRISRLWANSSTVKGRLKQTRLHIHVASTRTVAPCEPIYSFSTQSNWIASTSDTLVAEHHHAASQKHHLQLAPHLRSLHPKTNCRNWGQSKAQQPLETLCFTTARISFLQGQLARSLTGYLWLKHTCWITHWNLPDNREQVTRAPLPKKGCRHWCAVCR
jgi:hypothetical protein